MDTRKILVSSISAIFLSACGGGGTSPDTIAPSVSFSPSTLTVESGSTTASTVSATDAVGVTSGPDVQCDNGGSFANNNFTAPAVSTQTIVTCTATASDAAGNQGSATLTVTVNPPPDTTAPTLSFSPNSLTVDAESTAVVTLSAMDDREITIGPDVECDNGGSFDADTFTARLEIREPQHYLSP